MVPVAFERALLGRDSLPESVIITMLASHCNSINRIYNATWRVFCHCCSKNRIDPTTASVPVVLRFLQDGFDKGLAPNTLHRQVAALHSILPGPSDHLLTQDRHITIFLRGATNVRSPVIHRYPTWDLLLVLQVLMSPSFKPLSSISLHLLTLKVVFLVAITSARRISEIAALSVHPNLCIFHTNRVVLRTDPSFLRKINSLYHQSQELILPDICPRPRHSWRPSGTILTFGGLCKYIKRTAPFQKSEALFVSFLPATMGQKVSSSTISRWLKACIAKAYTLRSKPLPGRVLPHSTRSASTTAAWATQASVLDICRAATWMSLTPFARH